MNWHLKFQYCCIFIHLKSGLESFLKHFLNCESMCSKHPEADRRNSERLISQVETVSKFTCNPQPSPPHRKKQSSIPGLPSALCCEPSGLLGGGGGRAGLYLPRPCRWLFPQLHETPEALRCLPVRTRLLSWTSTSCRM